VAPLGPILHAGLGETEFRQEMIFLRKRLIFNRTTELAHMSASIRMAAQSDHTNALSPF
jgi:hypothetical protein